MARISTAYRSRLRSFADDEDDDEARNRWILSYADFITLLFAFFVVMYSVSSVNAGKFRVLSESMTTVFHAAPDLPAPIDLGGGMPGIYQHPGAPDGGIPSRMLEVVALDDFPVPVAEINPSDRRTVDLAKKVEHVLKGAIEMEQVNVRESENWTEIELDSEFMFATGQGRLSERATQLIAKAATVIQATDTPVRVEGFTDNIPVTGGAYGSNWELSAARAANVVESLATAGVEPERMSATGFGELHPVGDNASRDGRRQNRRVVVAIAKHKQVPGASASLAAIGQDREEVLPLRTLNVYRNYQGPKRSDCEVSGTENAPQIERSASVSEY